VPGRTYHEHIRKKEATDVLRYHLLTEDEVTSQTGAREETGATWRGNVREHRRRWAWSFS